MMGVAQSLMYEGAEVNDRVRQKQLKRRSSRAGETRQMTKRRYGWKDCDKWLNRWWVLES